MMRGSIGPTKIILMGYRIVDAALFHPVNDPALKNDVPLSGITRTVDRKTMLEIKRKANPEIRNREINFFLEIFISVSN